MHLWSLYNIGRSNCDEMDLLDYFLMFFDWLVNEWNKRRPGKDSWPFSFWRMKSRKRLHSWCMQCRVACSSLVLSWTIYCINAWPFSLVTGISLWARLLIALFLYSQENVKTKHPQLLYESKIYRILQGGSMEAFDCSYVLWDVRIRFRAGGTDNLCSDSWDTERQMVWCRRGLQCLGYGFTWTKPWGSIQFLQQEIVSEDCTYARWSDGMHSAIIESRFFSKF